jgi:hypothetical protein
VILAVEEDRVNIDTLEAVLGPLGGHRADPLFHRGDVLPRHHPTDDLVVEVDVVGVGLLSLLGELGVDLLDPFLRQRLVADVDDGDSYHGHRSA